MNGRVKGCRATITSSPASEVLRTNELQVWFLSEQVVKEPLVKAVEP